MNWCLLAVEESVVKKPAGSVTTRTCQVLGSMTTRKIATASAEKTEPRTSRQKARVEFLLEKITIPALSSASDPSMYRMIEKGNFSEILWLKRT